MEQYLNIAAWEYEVNKQKKKSNSKGSIFVQGADRYIGKTRLWSEHKHWIYKGAEQLHNPASVGYAYTLRWGHAWPQYIVFLGK